MHVRSVAAALAAVALLACQDTPVGIDPTSTAPGLAQAPTSVVNQPSGLTALTDRAFSSKSDGSGSGSEGWSATEASYPLFTIAADRSAPRSPTHVAQIDFPSGFAGGAAPAVSSVQFPTAQRELFVAVWIRPSKSFASPASGAAAAMFDLRTNGQPRVTFALRGAAKHPLTPSIELAGAPDGRGSLAANAGSATATAGAWQLVEVLATMNTPGVADGTIRVWLNGSRVIDYTDVQIVRSGESDTYTGLEINPVWGRSGDVVPSSMSLEIDHAYAAGATTATSGGTDTTGTGGTTGGTTGTLPVNECSTYRSGWIWCDDFEQDRTASYFEYDNAGGKFVRAASAGVGGSVAMRATYTAGQLSAGSLHLAFGRTPSTSIRPVDAGTANYRELYWRVAVKKESGWVGDGPGKLTRAMILAKSDWSQAMIAHAWSDETNTKYLLLDPASGTDASGNLITSGYNDFNNLRWLGNVRTDSTYDDNAHAGQWMCYEWHARLNDAGQSNAVFEMWVNGRLSARKSGFNWIGSYNSYGINAMFLEQYWNNGAPAADVRELDNLVVSTQPIGCGDTTTTSAPSAPAPVTVASVSVSPASAQLVTGQSTQLAATVTGSDGSTMTGQTITWTSSDATVATVSASGSVTALAVGSATITATASGKSGSASVSVSAPPTTSPSTSSNEPSGFTAFTTRKFDSKAQSSSDATGAEGWIAGDESQWPLFSIVQDAAAPRSPNNVGQMKYPAGFTGGYAPGYADKNIPAGYKRVYISLWMKLSSNFYGHSSYVNKMLFMWMAGKPKFVLSAFGAGTNALKPSILVQNSADPTWYRNPNVVTSAQVVRGQWQHWEVVVTANTPGQANGQVQWWIDGTLVSDWRDIILADTGESADWQIFQWSPTWGGVGGTVPADQYVWWDNVRVSLGN